VSRIDLDLVDSDRMSDVLEPPLAEVNKFFFDPIAHLPIGVLGQIDSARLRHALQSRGDIDAVAHEIAVALLDDVAEMNSDAEFDAFFWREASVAFG
jgi:hypothetical protein